MAVDEALTDVGRYNFPPGWRAQPVNLSVMPLTDDERDLSHWAIVREAMRDAHNVHVVSVER